MAVFQLTTGIAYVRGWTGTVTAGTVQYANGLQATPSISFINDSDTGFYWISSGIIGVSINGSNPVTIQSTGWNVTNDTGVRNSTVGTKINFPGTDGNITLLNNASNSFGLLQFGGSTSSFPALKRSATVIAFRLADDSGDCGITTSSISTTGNGLSLVATGAIFVGNNRLISGTAPTISSGFGTSPTIPNSNGSGAFTVNVGTGGTASSGVITMPTAATGWVCHIENVTANAANRANVCTVQTASTTTSITIQNQTVSTGAATAWSASDVLRIIAMAY